MFEDAIRILNEAVDKFRGKATHYANLASAGGEISEILEYSKKSYRYSQKADAIVYAIGLLREAGKEELENGDGYFGA